MCGFAGFIEFTGSKVSGESPYGILNKMMSCIVHRGPDDYGMAFYGYEMDKSAANKHIKIDADYPARMAYGLRRLSIIDLSENGRQPMQLPGSGIEIIFNGEIYNYIELREELRKVHTFKTSTDTEVLLAAYKHWGKEMLPKLDGMYAFVISDLNQKKLFCARDPIGIKPFYYSRDKSYFIFGSEPSVILNALQTPGTVDKQMISEFLIAGLSDHSDGTSYKEVKQLPGGCYMEAYFNGKVTQPVKYWHPPDSLFENDSDYAQGIYEQMKMSVARQLRADVSIGTSLSGGIDSGTIVTLAGEILNTASADYNTLTFSFPGFVNDESEDAKLIAENAGMKWHQVIPETTKLSSDLEKMIRGMNEPFATLSMFAQFKVMEAAHLLGIKVMLDGQGGDEVYLGYPRIAQRILKSTLFKGDIKSFFNEWVGLKKNATIPFHRSLLGNLFFTSPSALININKKRLRKYVHKDLLECYRTDFLDDLKFSGDIIKDQHNELTRFILPRLLKYADRNSMLFSVESRVPHLSGIMLNYALRLPLNWRVRNGWTKYAVRKAMSGKLPDRIIWSRQKKGFDIPQKFWVDSISSELKSWLSSSSLKSIINTEEIFKSIEHGNGGQSFLWRAISVGSWINLMSVKY